MTATSPVIVIGAARSGTKFLRDVLAAAPGVRAVPYDVNYVWRYRAAEPHDVLDPDSLTPARRRFIRRTLYRLAGIAANDSGMRLVEKTVSNGLRIPFVDAVFPTAHFVHLIRDGREVSESAMRLWQAPPDWGSLGTKLRSMPMANLGYAAWFGWNTLRGLGAGRKGGKIWGPRYPGIEDDVARRGAARGDPTRGELAQGELARVCATQWRETVTRARADLARLPAGRVTEIRYEDLVVAPHREEAGGKPTGRNTCPALDHVLAETGLDRVPADAAAIRAAWTDRVEPGLGGKWRRLDPAACAAIDEVTGPLMAELGYTEKAV